MYVHGEDGQGDFIRGTHMQTRALHRYAETTEARDHQGSAFTTGRYARMLTGTLADMRAC